TVITACTINRRKDMTTLTSAHPDRPRRWRALFAGLLASTLAWLLVQPAQAQLRVDISGVGATQYPIAIAEFSGDPQGQLTTQVIRDDLTRSGQFQLINTADVALQVESVIDHESWRNQIGRASCRERVEPHEGAA